MIAEYLETIGEQLGTVSQAAVFRGAMDAETARDLGRNNIKNDDYSAMTNIIEELYQEEMCRTVEVPEQKCSGTFPGRCPQGRLSSRRGLHQRVLHDSIGVECTRQ